MPRRPQIKPDAHSEMCGYGLPCIITFVGREARGVVRQNGLNQSIPSCSGDSLGDADSREAFTSDCAFVRGRRNNPDSPRVGGFLHH